MATTDIARISHDWARRYTGVAPQQGRVTLEAEENEERAILAEERRLELLDLVGPAATPDDGYAVSAGSSAYDIQVGPGTMYVGGLRVELEQAVDYFSQPDWLDGDTDPDFTPVNSDHPPAGDEHVVLVLVETDVSACEDPMLRETALGGPDAATRIRLLQHVERLPAAAGDCAGALSGDGAHWAAEGLQFDPATARLRSLSRLQVGFDQQPNEDPCQPSAKGGYLGAENQAVRVQVAAMNRDGTFDLLWGWDNASFLYSVTADGSTPPVLTLDRSPVDDYHRPAAGQAVQVLRATAELQSIDGVVEGYVAALNGAVGVLTAPYDPDTKTVPFPDPLSSQYLDAGETPQLFMRVWQQLLTGNELGTAVSLPGTGLQVTVTAREGSTLHVGDHWTIGVRPATPTSVLPARLTRTPQPPDGPRMWACPLAVVGWRDGAFGLLDDCRVPFPERDACCCDVTVRPAQAAQLQSMIDAAAARRSPVDRAHRITVCLRPGRYELPEPLSLEHRHSHLVLEGCHEGVVLGAAAGAEERFVHGLIEMVHADNVTISGIELQLPQLPAATATVTADTPELESFKTPLDELYRGLFVSIGIRAVHCAVLEVDRCLFRFRVGRGAGAAAGAADGTPRNVFGVGIFAGSECWGMRVERCRFLHDAEHLRGRPVEMTGPSEVVRESATGAREPASAIYERVASDRRAAAAQDRPQHMLAGILLAPSLLYHHKPGTTGQTAERALRLPSGALLRTLLAHGRIAGNEFTGLSIGILAVAQIGELRIEDNAIRMCRSGIWLGSAAAHAYGQVAAEQTVVSEVEPRLLTGIGRETAAAAADPQLMALSVIARTYPMPDAFTPSGKDRMLAQHVAEEAHKANEIAWMRQFVERAVAPFREQAAAKDTAAPAEAAAAPAEAAAAPAEAAAAPAKPAAPAEPAAPQTPEQAHQAKAVQLTHTLLSQFELGAAFSGESRWFELRLAGNDIECSAPFDAVAGAALTVWEGQQPAGSALICDNRLVTSGPRAAMVLGVPVVLCNANLLVAGRREGIGLVVLGSEQVTVTANVSGRLIVPPRPQPSPIDTWPPLNTVV